MHVELSMVIWMQMRVFMYSEMITHLQRSRRVDLSHQHHQSLHSSVQCSAMREWICNRPMEKRETWNAPPSREWMFSQTQKADFTDQLSSMMKPSLLTHWINTFFSALRAVRYMSL